MYSRLHNGLSYHSGYNVFSSTFSQGTLSSSVQANNNLNKNVQDSCFVGDLFRNTDNKVEFSVGEKQRQEIQMSEASVEFKLSKMNKETMAKSH